MHRSWRSSKHSSSLDEGPKPTERPDAIDHVTKKGHSSAGRSGGACEDVCQVHAWG
jgi:hypothetical protein